MNKTELCIFIERFTPQMIQRTAPINLPKSPEAVDVLNAKVCLCTIAATALVGAASLFSGAHPSDFSFSLYLIASRGQYWRALTSAFWCFDCSSLLFWALRFALLFVIESFVIWGYRKAKMALYCAFALVWVGASLVAFPAPWMAPRLSAFHALFLLKSLPLWLIRDSPFVTSLGFFLSLIVSYTNGLFGVWLFIAVGVQLFYFFYFVFPNIMFIR